jgi:hypothetical protein
VKKDALCHLGMPFALVTGGGPVADQTAGNEPTPRQGGVRETKAAVSREGCCLARWTECPG